MHLIEFDNFALVLVLVLVVVLVLVLVLILLLVLVLVSFDKPGLFLSDPSPIIVYSCH